MAEEHADSIENRKGVGRPRMQYQLTSQGKTLFPKDVGKKLIAEGKASPHHFIPQSEWISYYISDMEDIRGAIELFQIQYEQMTSYGKRRTTKIHGSLG